MTETQQQTLRQFVEGHRITMDFMETDENKHAPDWRDAHHYKVTLRRLGKQLTTYFSQGYAHTEPPKVDAVLSCLADDAAGVDASGFEDWAAELGYDTDSRKAERLYQTCKREAANLRAFLGADLYSDLLYHTERE
jgi:hypothetical protein